MRQVYYRVRKLLQSAAEIITKWGSYYKVRQVLHDAAVQLARLLEGQFQDMQFIYTEGSVSEAKAYYNKPCWNRAIVYHLDLG